MHLNPCSPNYLRRGLLRQRTKGDSSKIWPKFEGTHEWKEQGAYPPPEANKSKPSLNPPPPPPQLHADLGLKPNPELRRKRQHEDPKEGEIGPPKGNKQQRQSQDQRSKRSSYVESREDPHATHVHRTPCIWSPKLEVDDVPIA